MTFLADLFCNESFIYGGPGFSQSVELLQGTYGAVQLKAA